MPLASLKFYLLKYLLLIKQKTNQILSAAVEKIRFCHFKKTGDSSFGHRPGIIMEISKIKEHNIQVDLDIFWHILAYSDILRYKQAYIETIQAYRNILRTLCNPGIFRTLVYSEREAYSEPIHTENPGMFSQNPVKYPRWSVFAITVNGYNYFKNISFSRSTL